MTEHEFRRIALSLEGAEEGSHMGHPDFRVGGRIFASLSPDLASGMANLDPEQQADLRERYPEMFRPASGKWGEGGATMVTLANARADAAGEALTLAHQNRVRANVKKKK